MKSITSLAECGKRIVIRPARSRFLILLISSLHVVALLLLFFISLNFLLLLIFAMLIIFSLHRLISSMEKSMTHGLSLQEGESLLFQSNEISSWLEAEVLESFVSRWVIVLRIKTRIDSKQYSLVYAADSINSLFFRRLVVYLNS